MLCNQLEVKLKKLIFKLIENIFEDGQKDYLRIKFDVYLGNESGQFCLNLILILSLKTFRAESTSQFTGFYRKSFCATWLQFWKITADHTKPENCLNSSIPMQSIAITSIKTHKFPWNQSKVFHTVSHWSINYILRISQVKDISLLKNNPILCHIRSYIRMNKINFYVIRKIACS